MAANTAYRVCMKVGLKNPCEPKKLITPDKGKFTPEGLLPSTDLTDSDRKLLMNKAKKAIKEWVKEKFVEPCFLEEPTLDFDDEDLEVSSPQAVVGKKVWTVSEEELSDFELDDLNQMILNIAEQKEVPVPPSHPYKTVKAAINLLGKDL